MKCYISGAITGVKDFERQFEKAEDLLKKNPEKFGLTDDSEIVNPCQLGKLVEVLKIEPTWTDYMRFDIAELMNCNSIAMLPNYQQSEGAKLELYLAEKLNMEVIYLKDSDFFD